MNDQMVADLTRIIRKARAEAVYARVYSGSSAVADALEDMAQEIEKALNKYNYTVVIRPGDSRGLGFRISPYGLFASLHAR